MHKKFLSKNVLGLLALFVVVGLIIGFVLAYENDNSNTSSRESSTSVKESSDDATQTTTYFTTAEVAKHSSSNDCWMIINNKVYRITEYIPDHPGKDSILLACGKDGTKLFTTGMDSEGKVINSDGSHSSAAEDQLKQYLIGELKD